MFVCFGSGELTTRSVQVFMLDIESRLPPNAPGEVWTMWLVILATYMAYDITASTQSSMPCSQLMDVFLLTASTMIKNTFPTHHSIISQC
ncbi:hypothetical protein CEP54_007131 [Fusarium duplospermum]|uniref:Uncharacterized protein n=1 Tax=Fusarium duplospermum TaxID=1325734 RepID=A0A428Q335_9HYPO|nr:hypothetical protein CEP54_007131 [Fusarium duplospermum]